MNNEEKEEKLVPGKARPAFGRGGGTASGKYSRKHKGGADLLQ